MTDTIQNFYGVLGLAVIGVFLIILRRREIGNPNVIDSLGLLILIMEPVSASIVFFAEPKTHLYWWLAVYFGGLMLWFLIGFTVFNRQTDEAGLRRQSNFTHTIALGSGIYVGVVILWLFLNIIPLFTQQNKG